MSWRGAVKAARGGVSLDVEVTPASRESRFPSGYNAWRGRLEATVKARPQDGAANAELTRLVAEALGVAASSVRVQAGATGRRKTLHVEGLDADEATRRLSKGFN